MTERRARFAFAIAAAVLALLAWRVLALGLADRLARGAPAAALAWNDAHPEALLRAAAALARSEPDRAATLARRAIRASPLDGRGYRQLAGLAATAPLARPLLEIASLRSPRDVRSHLALVRDALAGARYEDAARHLDMLLRVEEDELPKLEPMLQSFAAAPGAREALAARLAGLPPWRSRWFVRLVQNAPQPAAIAPFVDALRLGPGGLREVELDVWLERLLRDGLWLPAYIAWVDALPPAQRARLTNLHNGDFEAPLAGRGFDWRVREVPGAIVGPGEVEGMGGAHALRVEFTHRRVPFRHLSQPLVLAPGRYRLEGRVRLDDLDTERGLAWFVACAPRGPQLARSEPLRGDAPWHAFTVEFTVPTAACTGQWLTLQLPARIPAEQRIGGTAWFDDLSVKRLPESMNGSSRGIEPSYATLAIPAARAPRPGRTAGPGPGPKPSRPTLHAQGASP